MKFNIDLIWKKNINKMKFCIKNKLNNYKMKIKNLIKN